MNEHGSDGVVLSRTDSTIPGTKEGRKNSRRLQNIATPTTAPIITPNHPAFTLRAPLLFVGVAALFVDVELDVALLLVVVAAAELVWAGAEVAPARGAVD